SSLSPLFTCPFFPLRSPPCSTLFPYTTLFRSLCFSVASSVSAADRASWSAASFWPSARATQAAAARVARAEGQNEAALQLARSRSEEHTAELQALTNLACPLLL